MPQIPQDLHRRSRDSERYCARGRDFRVSCGPADRPRCLGSSIDADRRPRRRSCLGRAVLDRSDADHFCASGQASAWHASGGCDGAVLAAMTLGGPAVAGWVAAIGTTEMRELRGRIPWYGTLANHADRLPTSRRRRSSHRRLRRRQPASRLRSTCWRDRLLRLNTAIAGECARCSLGHHRWRPVRSIRAAVFFSKCRMAGTCWPCGGSADSACPATSRDGFNNLAMGRSAG